MDNVGSDFDLNSLIEGDVDDDEFGENFTNKEDREGSKTPVVSFYEPLKVRLIRLLIRLRNLDWNTKIETNSSLL